MNVSIFYRSATVWNIILFIFLMFFFLYFQEGLFQARSVFDRSFMREALIQYAPLNTLCVIAGISALRLKNASKWLFVACVCAVSGYTVYNLSLNFSKSVVIALFLFVLTAYYFYQFLNIEINEAYYNPQYGEDDLFAPGRETLSCRVEDLETGKTFEGKLTNWNTNGCFVFFSETPKEARLRKVALKTRLDERRFEAFGSLAAKAADNKGFGFRLYGEKDEAAGADFGWRDYHSIIDQMGYDVELLK